MDAMPVTSLVAGVFALLIVPLSIQISLRRAKLNTVFGDAGDGTLRKAVHPDRPNKAMRAPR
jgi:uncharacterized protein